jgi:hypothetical protein
MPIPAGSRYVAMGSSFAAGPGLPSRVPGSPRRVGRATGNYAHLVARELGLDLHDVGFVPRLMLASLPWPLRMLSPVKAVIAARLRDRAPACRVVVVDYLSVLPQDGPAPEPPPSAEITTWGRALAARLAATTQAAAGTAGWTYVAASTASADHHAWSAEPWTRRFHLSLLRPGTSTGPEVHL